MFITQSAVSHAIKRLETSVDTLLIERKRKTLALTDAGLTLFESCERIFYEIERADQDIVRFKQEARVRIRIGSTVEFGTSILINHIKALLDAHPDILLEFFFSHHLETALVQDEVDLIIDCKDHLIPNLAKIYLFQEQYVTIASPAFVRENRIRSLEDLERINILSNDKHLEWWQNFISAIPEKNEPA